MPSLRTPREVPAARDLRSPSFWRERLRSAKLLHQAVFRCSHSEWVEINTRHQKILHQYILPQDSILEVGCCWGRLLHLLPPEWDGFYLGIDVCPDFLRMARGRFPDKFFVLGDAFSVLPSIRRRFDWCIAISVVGMYANYDSLQSAEKLVTLMREKSDRVMILEYREDTATILPGMN